MYAQRAISDSATLADFWTIRRSEFGRLDAGGHAYLDYTGAALYAASQIEAQHSRLLAHVFGNPHSENPAALESTERMERARSRVLAFFCADPAEYDLVFAANASAALRIVGESFPFERGSRFVLTADNHNSVNGIRSFATRAGARVQYVPLDGELRPAAPLPWLDGAPRGRFHLFAYPAQSNYSGARHTLDWVELARDAGYRVLLDTAAFVPTCALDLSAVRPDFLCVSFYKMFGFPTGIGALIARREALSLLRRPWFAGGTIEWVATYEPAHALRVGSGGFEDGTPHFLAFDAVCDGLDLLESIGMECVEAHVRTMTARLLDGLSALRHPGGQQLVAVYGPSSLEGRGGTVAFNLLDERGVVQSFEDVVAFAASQRVSVRGGCFCNPGCEEAALRFDAERASKCRRALRENYSFSAFTACRGGPSGAVRASIGIPTIESDIDRLLSALEGFGDR
jgi:selenocysteine lyase/cysteine desulfurase